MKRPRKAPRQPKGPPSFQVIGIGGSAGGIAPCAELLAAIPASAPVSIVIAMHLSPTHASGLPAIYSHATTMPVTEAREGEALVAGHVYVIPPGSALIVRAGALHLEARSSRRFPPSVIDRLFTSLAQSLGQQAVGVVLSGTGSDGTAGLRAIRDSGGVTYAQSLDTAQQDGMPGSAVAEDVVDHVLSPTEIGLAIATGSVITPQQPPATITPQAQTPEAVSETVAPAGVIDEILRVLGAATGVDFSHYKRPTLERRIARRMEQLQITEREKYLEHLEAESGEAMNLYREVLIHVTEFFRDAEGLTELRRAVLVPLLRARQPNEPLRIWVAGCATGEEAYSVAIEALEAAAEAGATGTVQLFATDLSDSALAIARAGAYPESISASVSGERLARCFRRTESGYEVHKRLRAICIFARHDLTRDPPYSRMDVVICRNVLIYLDAVLQRRALRAFHYALKPAGTLMLGPAETAALVGDLFVLSDRKHRLYLPSDAHAQWPLMEVLAQRAHPPGEPLVHPPTAESRDRRTVADLERIAEQLYRHECPRARIIVNAEMEIVHLQGATAQYLDEPSGEPTTRLLKAVRPALRVALGRLLRESQRKEIRVRQTGVRFEGGSRVRSVDLTVLPLARESGHPGYSLILFEPHAGPVRKVGATRGRATPAPRGARLRELQQELNETREYMTSVVELHETTQAELQSAYEEALSSNEEFQSTNEELETTKEELQSMNEEITTLNEEMQQRNAELGQSLADLTNIFESTAMPLVLLDPGLRIRRFSPEAGRVFGLAPADLGHELGERPWTVTPPNLIEVCRQVLADPETREVEVRDSAGRANLLRISPYRAADRAVAGLVLTLVDVEAMRQLVHLSELALQHSDVIIDTVQHPLLVLDSSARILRANGAFCRTFHLDSTALKGRPIYQIMSSDWDFAGFRELVESGGGTREIEVTHHFHGLGERIISLSAFRMLEPGRNEPSLLIAIDDVTERRRMEGYIQQAAKAEATGVLAGGVAHDLNNQLTALLGFVAELESGTGTPAERVADLAEIRHAAENMADTTKQLLAFGRRQILKLVPIEANALIAAESSLLRRILGPGIELVTCPSSQPLWFTADPVQMEHVFLNLAFNARDAMPSGGRLEISAHAAVIDESYIRRYGAKGAVSGEYVRLSVKDTGTGMDAATLARVFEPFFTTKDLGRGSGLGLASVYGIVKQSGGWIWVDSTPGQGTTIKLDFPVTRGAFVDPVQPPQIVQPAVAQGDATILVVDDEEAVLRAVAKQLRRMGYQVLEAGGGAAALELASQKDQEIDLLLTDLAMLGMNGPELARRMTELRPETPVLYMSAHPQKHLVSLGWLTTAEPLLTKPFVYAELAAAVQEALANRTIRQQA